MVNGYILVTTFSKWTEGCLSTQANQINVAILLLLHADSVIANTNFYQISNIRLKFKFVVNYLCTMARSPFVLKHITNTLLIKLNFTNSKSIKLPGIYRKISLD